MRPLDEAAPCDDAGAWVSGNRRDAQLATIYIAACAATHRLPALSRSLPGIPQTCADDEARPPSSNEPDLEAVASMAATFTVK